MNKLLKNQYVFLSDLISNFKDHLHANPKMKLTLAIFSVFGIIYTASILSESKEVVFRDYQNPSFEKGRILGTQTSSYLNDKKNMLTKTARKIMSKNKLLEDRLMRLEKRLEAKS